MLTFIALTSCEIDNFYDVSKSIVMSDTISVNEEFEFSLLLHNKTNEKIRLTLDKEIRKSLYFLPVWYCKERMIHGEYPKPTKIKHDYYIKYLQPKDSISFTLTAKIESFSNGDSLKLIIKGYEKDFRLVNPTCDNFVFIFGGMWIPGDGPFGDSMEGYNFRKTVNVKN
jgi:hypothetical protein